MSENFDYKWLESNYKKLLKDILLSQVEEIDEDEDGLRILTKSYDKMLNSLDYERLDDYYEQGLSEENIMDDDADILTVGYALITKYRLSYEDYYKWASTQERRYLVILYNLIGVKPPVEKRNDNSCKSDSTIVDALVDDVAKLTKVLSVSDGATKWPILGENLVIPEEELSIVELRDEISNIDYQSIALFENEFDRSCTDCNSALTNVETSMAFAINAELVKCKKLLVKRSINDETIQVIVERFKKVSDVSEVSTLLQEALEAGIKELKKAASMAEDDYVRRSDTEFIGGGFGIKGALAGMLTANVMGAVYDSFNTSHYKGDLERMTKKFKASMDKQFVGAEAKDKYIETLLDIFESLKCICIEEIYKERKINDDLLDSYIGRLEKCERSIAGDKYRSIVVDLLCAFPYDKRIYEYINEKFICIDKELETIARTLDIKYDVNGALIKITKSKDIKNNPSKYKNLSYIEINEILAEESKKQKEEYFEKTENKTEYSFNISLRKNVKAIIHGTDYSDRSVNDYAYNLMDDRVTNVISKQDNKAQYVLYLSDHIMLTDTTLYIDIDSESITAIDIKDIEEIVVGENFYLGGGYRVCLSRKDGSVKQIELGIDENDVLEYSFIFDVINLSLDPLVDKSRVRMHKKSYVSGAGSIAFCEKCGIQRIITETTGILNNHRCGKCHSDVSALSRILLNVIHDKCDVDLESEIKRLAESGLFEDENELASTYEIKEFENKKDVDFENKVLEAYKAQIDIQKGKLDYQSVAQYRAILKRFFSKYKSKYVVNKYDYEVPSEVTEYIADKEKLGQFVIYSDDEICITDFNVYIRAERGYNEIPIIDLLEIIPVETGIKQKFRGYLYSHKNDKYEMAYSSHVISNIEVIWWLNIALAEIYGIRNKKSLMQYFDKRYDDRDDAYVYCYSCKKYVTRYCVHGDVLNGFHCSDCNSDMMFGGYDRAVVSPKENEIVEAKNIISEIIHLDIDEVIASEVAEDKKTYSGILEYGILKHEEYEHVKAEEKKQREIIRAKENEEEKRVLSRYHALLNKYEDDIDGYRKGFFEKDCSSEDIIQKLSKMKGKGLYIGAADTWSYSTFILYLADIKIPIKDIKKVRTLRCFRVSENKESVDSKTFFYTEDSFEPPKGFEKIADNLYCVDTDPVLDEYGDMDFLNALIGDKESEESLSKDINVYVYCRRCGEISLIPLKDTRKNMSCPCCNNVFFNDEYIIIGGSRLGRDSFIDKEILKYLNLEGALKHSFDGTNLREILKNNSISGICLEGEEKFNEMVSNAKAKYVSLSADEYPIAIHNTALIKRGSSGYLFTNKKLYINTDYSKKTTLDIDSIVGFEVNTENEICAFDTNGTRYPICMPVFDVDNETRKICQGLIVCLNFAKKVTNNVAKITKKETEVKSNPYNLIQCPKCKSDNLDTARFCVSCGSEIKKETAPLMVKCSSCGKEVLPSVKFCNYCGHSMIEKKICSKCGKEISPTAKFCNFCGEKA